MTHQFFPDPSPGPTDDKKIEQSNLQADDVDNGLQIAMLRQIWNKRRLRAERKDEE